MATQSIDTTLFASVHPNISKRLSVSGLIYSSMIMLIGVIALFATRGIVDKSSVLNLALVLFGSGLILFGLFRVFGKGKEKVYLPTGSIAREQSFFFDLKYLDKLRDCVNNGQFPLDSEMKSEASGNIRMDVIMSQDKKFAAIQLFQFVPYAYNPITSIHYFTDSNATDFSSFLVTSKQRS